AARRQPAPRPKRWWRERAPPSSALAFPLSGGRTFGRRLIPQSVIRRSGPHAIRLFRRQLVGQRIAGTGIGVSQRVLHRRREQVQRLSRFAFGGGFEGLRKRL